MDHRSILKSKLLSTPMILSTMDKLLSNSPYKSPLK